MGLTKLQPELHTLVGLYVGLGYYSLKGCSKQLNAEIAMAKALHRALRPELVAEMQAGTPGALGIGQFRWAWKRGYLPLAQWLTDRYELTSSVIRFSDNYALRNACEDGHLPMAQWLVTHFELTIEDVRDSSNYALRWACKGGHLPVVRWLVTHFGLTVEDVRVNKNEVLRWACENGYLEVTQWLAIHFKLTSDDARDGYNEAHAMGGAWRSRSGSLFTSG